MRTLEEVANHEAAHPAMAVMLDIPIKFATVIPDAHRSTLGHVITTPPDGISPHDFHVKSALVLLAGLLEDDWCSDYRPTLSTSPTHGDAHDLAHITEHLTDEQYHD